MSAGRWAPPLCWSALILFVTSLPNPNLPAPGRSDLLLHAAIYGGLGYLSARAAGSPRLGALVLVVVGCSVFGAVDEWHQRFIAGRFAGVDDWGADTLGAAIGVAAYAVAARQRREPIT